MIYLQNKALSESRAVPMENKRPEYLIQSNDVLAVQIKSSQREFNDIFNSSGENNNFLNNPGAFFLSGYSVDNGGFISIPTLGKVMVRGLSLNKATEVVKKEVDKLLNDATVQVKLMSFKISVVGEVKNPGYFYIYNNQATILEGLGLAGDLSDFGNRKKVKLVRQTDTGSEVVLLDLTNPDLAKSKYFYLLPNDAIYVEPLKVKATRGNLAQLGILFSGVTTLVLLLNYVNNNVKL